jgi:hypothetical protein
VLEVQQRLAKVTLVVQEALLALIDPLVVAVVLVVQVATVAQAVQEQSEALVVMV